MQGLSGVVLVVPDATHFGDCGERVWEVIEATCTEGYGLTGLRIRWQAHYGMLIRMTVRISSRAIGMSASAYTLHS